MKHLRTHLLITVVVVCAGMIATASIWTNVRAQEAGLFKVGTCWRPLEASVTGSQFKVLETVGAWVRTTSPAIESFGSTWINTDLLSSVQEVRGATCR
jgi:hypothetical protein